MLKAIIPLTVIMVLLSGCTFVSRAEHRNLNNQTTVLEKEGERLERLITLADEGGIDLHTTTIAIRQTIGIIENVTGSYRVTLGPSEEIAE